MMTLVNTFFSHHDVGVVDWGANEFDPNLIQSAPGFAVPEIPPVYIEEASSLTDRPPEPGSSSDRSLYPNDAGFDLDFSLPAHSEWTRLDHQHQHQHQELALGSATTPSKSFQQWTNFQLQNPFNDFLQHYDMARGHDDNQPHELTNVRAHPQLFMAPPSSQQFSSTDYAEWHTIPPEHSTQPQQPQQHLTSNLAHSQATTAAGHGSNLDRWHGKSVSTLQHRNVDTSHSSKQAHHHNGRVRKTSKPRKDHLRTPGHGHTLKRLLTKAHVPHKKSVTTELSAMTYRKFDIRGHTIVLGVSSRDGQNCIHIEVDINGRAKRWVQDMSQFGPKLYETFEAA